MRWYVLCMFYTLVGNELRYRQAEQGVFPTGGEAVAMANLWNKTYQAQPRYFVVSEEEYQSYWKKVVS